MRNALTRALVACATVLLSPAIAAATGTIHGVVLNGVNGAPVPGAVLSVDGAEITTTTDIDGLFKEAVPEGAYVVEVSKDSFTPQRVTDVQVIAGEVAQFSVVLMPETGSAEEGVAAGADGEDAVFAEEITVITEADTATESAVLLERKQAAEISDLIGQEEFGKNPGGDAAGVLMRVTGVSVQEGKYVYVRGLGDRYSNATLNGSKLPSTEFEKKVVPLDLFPSDLLDKVSVSKSYSVTQPGEFAAGSIDMRTRQFPANRTYSVGISAAHNSETTGDDFQTAAAGLSFFGSGGQSLPGSIPSDFIQPESPITGEGFSREEIEAFGEDLIGSWTPAGRFDTAFDSGEPGSGFDLGFGDTIGDFGVVLSATYGSDYQNRLEDRNFYNLSGGQLIPNEEYVLDYSTQDVKQGAMANFAYALDGNHRLELRSIFTDLATGEGRFQEGFFSDLNDNVRDYRVSYLDQEILNLQLRGEHFLPELFASGSLLEWRVAQSEATTEENRRQTLYLQGADLDYRLTDNAQSGFMYFNDLEDDLGEVAADWSTYFSGRLTGSFQTGVALSQNDREFLGRRLRYAHRNVFGLDLTQPPEVLFSAENIGDAFSLEEITRATDTYLGDHEVTAAYVQGDIAWGKWRLIAGVRYEDSQLEVNTFDRNLDNPDPIVTVLGEQELPFALSAVYQLRDDMNLRAVVSQTLNRPSFRELAPFTFTHIVGGYAVQGNPELVSATIDSYDLRWEWFPAPTEVIAASLFYKEFDKPIEQVVIPGAEFLETFANAESAENFGLELEVRRSLGTVSDALDRFTGILNYTYVDSEITIDPEFAAETNVKRALVGQPDNVVNAVLEWDNPPSNSLVRVLWNLTGDRVAIAGAFGLPDTIQEARSSLDLNYIQGLGSPNLKAKLTARNITNEEWEWTQGGLPFRLYDKGREIGLSLSYSR